MRLTQLGYNVHSAEISSVSYLPTYLHMKLIPVETYTIPYYIQTSVVMSHESNTFSVYAAFISEITGS